MKGHLATRSMVLLVAGVVAAGTLALSSAPTTQAPSQGPMGFWEAYARGFVSVVMENEAFKENGVPVELPVGIRVTNTASVPVVISEEAVLMSPHPSQSPPPSPADTTADAVLTNGTIPARGSALYSFGEFVLAGWLTGPTWWDLEEMQYSKAGVAFAVGGETLPFALRSLVEHPFYNGPSDNTQISVYAFLRSHPTVVVGKLPLWAATQGTAGATVRVRLDATNLAVWATDDVETQNVNVTNGILRDDVPAGWTVQAGSYSNPPDLVVNHANGSTTLEWNVSLPAPEVSGQGNFSAPTPYVTVTRFYTLVAPAFAGTLTLPRAHSDMFRTGVPDAESAPVLIAGNLPPVADAGGPYTGHEGDTILLNASKSSDPEGDPLQYRWSFTDNGTWDTAWSSSPTSTVTYTDEFVGQVRVEVTDGHSVTNATAPVTILNVPPTIRSLTASRSVQADFRLVLAGEKGHDATFTLGANGTTLARLRVMREPGDPMAQSRDTGMLTLSTLTPITATVLYTPADDPVNGHPNGDNPAWLIVSFPNGTSIPLSHNFNVQHKATWNWSLGDLRTRIFLGGVTLRASLFDPGADALTVRWDFGDGTNLSQVFPNGPANDMPENVVGGPAPMAVVATVVHPFPMEATYTVTLTVTDADGASTSATLTVSLG
jgi:hypothetical protein